MLSLTDLLSSDHIETIRRDSLHKVEATCDETRAMCDELLASRAALAGLRAFVEQLPYDACNIEDAQDILGLPHCR